MLLESSKKTIMNDLSLSFSFPFFLKNTRESLLCPCPKNLIFGTGTKQNQLCFLDSTRKPLGTRVVLSRPNSVLYATTRRRSWCDSNSSSQRSHKRQPIITHCFFWQVAVDYHWKHLQSSLKRNPKKNPVLLMFLVSLSKVLCQSNAYTSWCLPVLVPSGPKNDVVLSWSFPFQKNFVFLKGKGEGKAAQRLVCHYKERETESKRSIELRRTQSVFHEKTRHTLFDPKEIKDAQRLVCHYKDAQRLVCHYKDLALVIISIELCHILSKSMTHALGAHNVYVPAQLMF